MIITKKALARRTVLRGLGAGLALPLLDSMVPAMVAAAETAAKPVKRLGVVYVPNGMVMKQWTPAAEGTGFEYPAILKPLEAYRDQLTVLTGLNSIPPANALNAAGVHARASTRFLTDIPPTRSDTSEVSAGISMDQLVAKQLGHDTQLASLEIAIEGRDLAGIVRHRLQLRLHQHDLLARGEDAAADGERPADAVRADVRRQRQHRPGRAARPPAGRQEHSRLGERPHRSSADAHR